MKSIYLQIPDQFRKNSVLVLATVTRTSGSTPQKPGSSALFDSKGIISGTVGGGIVEGKIRKIALESAITKKSGQFHFSLSNDISNTEEAICGGQISILVDANLKNHLSVFELLSQSLSDRIPGVLVTMVTGLKENMVLINRYWITESSKPALPSTFLEELDPVAMSLLREANPSDYKEMELSIPGEESSSLFLLEPVFPPSHLVIAGAGHIGKALAHLGHRLDFEITIIDDRPEFANAENIPDADHIIVDDIGEASAGLDDSVIQ